MSFIHSLHLFACIRIYLSISYPLDFSITIYRQCWTIEIKNGFLFSTTLTNFKWKFVFVINFFPPVEIFLHFLHFETLNSRNNHVLLSGPSTAVIVLFFWFYSINQTKKKNVHARTHWIWSCERQQMWVQRLYICNQQIEHYMLTQIITDIVFCFVLLFLLIHHMTNPFRYLYYMNRM